MFSQTRLVILIYIVHILATQCVAQEVLSPTGGQCQPLVGDGCPGDLPLDQHFAAGEVFRAVVAVGAGVDGMVEFFLCAAAHDPPCRVKIPLQLADESYIMTVSSPRAATINVDLRMPWDVSCAPCCSIQMRMSGQRCDKYVCHDFDTSRCFDVAISKTSVRERRFTVPWGTMKSFVCDMHILSKLRNTFC